MNTGNFDKTFIKLVDKWKFAQEEERVANQQLEAYLEPILKAFSGEFDLGRIEVVNFTDDAYSVVVGIKYEYNHDLSYVVIPHWIFYADSPQDAAKKYREKKKVDALEQSRKNKQKQIEKLQKELADGI